MREARRVRHHGSSYVAAHVRDSLGARPGLRSGSTRCGAGTAGARIPDIDAGVHARHRGGDEESHHRDDCATSDTGRCPVTAAGAATPSQMFDADWAAKWREHLIDIIDPAWRPDEYDHAQLMFVPASRRAQAQCMRPGCTQIAVRRTLCLQCRREKWLSGMDTEEFAQIPVTGERAVSMTKCLVGCQRRTLPTGLCRPHSNYYRQSSDGDESHASVLAWIDGAPTWRCCHPANRASCPDATRTGSIATACAVVTELPAWVDHPMEQSRTPASRRLRLVAGT